jgi:hypothetical protein
MLSTGRLGSTCRTWRTWHSYSVGQGQYNNELTSGSGGRNRNWMQNFNGKLTRRWDSNSKTDLKEIKMYLRM